MHLLSNSTACDYELKYRTKSLHVRRDFWPQFQYLIRNYWNKNPLASSDFKLIDLGGGTGEYTKLLSDHGIDATCFDYSVSAITKAQKLGIKTIQSDFYTCQFQPEYNIALAMGFSCLNTDSCPEFMSRVERIKRCLLSDGILLYWGKTDLSGKWSKSGWYNFSAKDLGTIFGHNHVVLPLAPLQLHLPHKLNVNLSKKLLSISNLVLPRHARLLGVFFTGHDFEDYRG